MFAAFAGTWLAMLSQSAVGLEEFTASYLLVGLTAALTVVLAAMLRVPTPTKEECARCGRPLLQIARQPDYVVAVIAAALGYFVMSLVMDATPLAMRAYAFSFGFTAFVIQWHVAAMFGPSFASGPLIARIGVTRVLALGGALMSVAVIINLLGVGAGHFWFALVALGLGWNFLFVGGTTLLTRTYVAEERAKSQGLNDFIVYAAIALAALAAGEIHSALGWRAVNAASIPALLMIMASVAWLAAGRTKDKSVMKGS